MKVKNIDVSNVPNMNIKWPVTPDTVLTEA
ncbi:TPA: hypothetical protein ACQ301_003263 [Yersinia enterocolitica]